jgi:hypothetical protein
MQTIECLAEGANVNAHLRKSMLNSLLQNPRPCRRKRAFSPLTFFDTSENAVKTQIWIAVSAYVLVAIVRKRLKIEARLYQLLLVFSVTISSKPLFYRHFRQTTSKMTSITPATI